MGVVYVVWGSTYVGIRLLVETIPPLIGASARFLIAGAVMLAFLAARLGSATSPETRHLIFVLPFAALAVVCTTPARAQLLQGSITGNVTDSTQAAVVEAKVVATEQQTNFTRDTTTNASGVYNLLQLPPGTYTVIVTGKNAVGTSAPITLRLRILS